MGPNIDSKLEKIANGINNSDKTTLGGIKRVLYIPVAVYFGGAPRRKYQKKFADKIGWKEKNLTIANAIIFGIGGSLEYYLGGMATRGFFDDQAFIKNLESNFFSGFGDAFGVSAQAFFYTLATFDLLQSIGRVVYSQLTGKAIVSISLLGAVTNAGNYTYNFIKKRQA